MKCILLLLLLTVFSSVNSDTLPNVLPNTIKKDLEPTQDSSKVLMVLSDSGSITQASQSIDSTKPDSLPTNNLLMQTKNNSLVNSTDSTTANPGLLPDSIKNMLRLKRNEQQKWPLNTTNFDSDSIRSFDGWHFGYGVGLSLGNLAILNSWEKTLPTSLESLGLDSRSFINTDTTTGPLLVSDSTLIEFKDLEEPTTYSITFPFTLSISRFREKDRFMSSLSFSYISKQQKALILSKKDTTGSKISIRNKINFYSLTLNLLYSIQIPPEFFSINKFDRTDFFVCLGFSPLVSIGTSYDISFPNDERNKRFNTIGQIVADSAHNSLTTYGLAGSFRTGINTIRHLSDKRSLEVTLALSLNQYDYFKKDGAKVFKKDINRNTESTSHLSFFSSRFDLSFSLLRRLKSKQEE